MTPRARIEEEARAAIRASGLDPVREPQAVRQLVEESVARSASRMLAEGQSLEIDDGADLVAFARELHDDLAGLGPLQRYLDDPEIEEIWINSPSRVFVARGGRSELTPLVLTEREVRELVERMLRFSGRRIDLSSPFVDATLADGSRLHVVIPDVTARWWSVNIRRFVLRASHVSDLVAPGMLTRQAADFLDASIRAGLSILVVGGTQAGKTTVANALLGSVPATERIVSCEEVFELRIDHPDWVALQTRDASLEGSGEIPLRRLVREALRMRPTRLVVGEVRQAEALDLLIAMNSGMPAMATLHANSAREAITKICTLPLLAGANIASDFVLPTVAGCVDLVVHLASDAHGRRGVRELACLTGRHEGGVIEMASILRDRGDGLRRGAGFPRLEAFERHGIDIHAILDDRSEAA